MSSPIIKSPPRIPFADARKIEHRNEGHPAFAAHMAGEKADPTLTGLECFTPKQLSQLLNLSTSTLCRLRQLGQGPVWVQLSPGRIGYPVDEALAYLRSRASK